MAIYKRQLKNGLNSYQVINWVGAKQVCKRFRNKKDAEKYDLEMKLRNKSNQECQNTVDQLVTVEELAIIWLDRHAELNKAPSSVERDKTYLRNQIFPRFGKTRANEIKPHQIEFWLGDMAKQKLSPKTANDAFSLFRKILHDSVRWGLIAFNPASGVKKLKRPAVDYNFWEQVEANSFLDYVKTEDPIKYPVFVMALNTGLRKGELAALKWDCVDLNNKLIRVKRSFCSKLKTYNEYTKNKKIRSVPINDVLVELLIGLKQNKIGDDDFVLPRIDYEHLHRTIKVMAENAGIRKIRFHDLRHTCASHLVINGVRLEKVQAVLGHSSINMTQRYVHLSPEHLIGTTDVLNFGAREDADVISIVSEANKRKVAGLLSNCYQVEPKKDNKPTKSKS